MVDLGGAFFRRYAELARGSEPFVRASGSGRVVASARKFAEGRDGGGGIVVVPEGPASNNTLDHWRCAAFEDGPWSRLADEKQQRWREVWARPIAARLNAKLRGANLTALEAVLMMDLCSLGTVASPNATRSDFCRLFSHDEWRGYDYHQSLDK